MSKSSAKNKKKPPLFVKKGRAEANSQFPILNSQSKVVPLPRK
jgi:hypothetical protein